LVMASVADTFGRIGAAIVSAGAASRVPFAALDDNCWHDALRAKFFPCVYAIQAALPHLERRGQGSLVAVVGSGGKNPDPDSLPASAANAALLCAVTGISRAVAPDIRLNSVNPGIIETPRYWRRVESEAARTSTSPEDVHARLSRRPFMQRLGQAAEVAKACLYLVSDESCGIRGAELAVDGGGRRG
jgi:NAD(P)-dependent dehydrogenase (short-subunit alcohol dehydrogenase family)